MELVFSDKKSDNCESVASGVVNKPPVRRIFAIQTISKANNLLYK